MRLYSMVALLAGLSACTSSAATVTPATPITEAEVAAFMKGYADDLRTQNREGLIARYDTAGVYMLGRGNKSFVVKDTLALGYRTLWTGPAYFEWANLSYEPVGTDAMVVAGQFRWLEPQTTDTVTFSYTSLVRRTAAGLRIRLEDESPAPGKVE